MDFITIPQQISEPVKIVSSNERTQSTILTQASHQNTSKEICETTPGIETR